MRKAKRRKLLRMMGIAGQATPNGRGMIDGEQ